MRQCQFCGTARKQFLLDNGYDIEKMYFFENDDFSISPDLSPLVKGHLLAIPKYHYASFGEMPNNSIYKRIIEKSKYLLGTDDLLIFEHGAVIEGKGGASIDHAHLHIMPRPNGISEDTIDSFIKDSGYIYTEKIYCEKDKLHELFLQRQPYIFYSIHNKSYVYPVEKIPHQFLRLMLQPYCQLSYNWKKTYMTEECKKNVMETINFIELNQIEERR